MVALKFSVSAFAAMAALFAVGAQAQCDTMDTTKYYKIVNQQSYDVLTVKNGYSAYPGSSVYQDYSEDDKPYKLWRFEPTSDGHYRIVSEKDNMACDGTFFWN